VDSDIHPDGVFRGWCDTWLDPRFRQWSIEALVAKIRRPLLAIRHTGTSPPR